MTITDLTRIDRSVDIEASPERIWRALTDPAEISGWFQVSVEGSVEPGNEVWMTALHPDFAGQRFRVLFVEMTPPQRLVWKWHPGAIDPAVDYSLEPRTTVTFTLEPIAKGTRLSVAESGFDQVALERRAKVYADNTGGWTAVVLWIRKHVEKQG